MLERLLGLIAEGGVHSYQDLAASLAIPQSLLDVILEDLGGMGYLRAVSTGCTEGKCSACPIGGCSVAGPGRLWVLTAKGAEAAERLRSGVG